MVLRSNSIIDSNKEIDSNENAIHMEEVVNTFSNSKPPDITAEREKIYAAYDNDAKHSKYWRSLQSIKPVRLHK